MGIVFYMLIFAMYCNSTISYFLPSGFSHQWYVILMFTIAVFLIFRSFFTMKGQVNKRIFAVWSVWIAILILFFATSYIFGMSSGVYDSFGRAILIQSTPVVFFVSLIANNNRGLDSVKRLSPYVAIVFTFVSFVSAFHPESTTSGGFANTDYGLNYQSISYMAAYAASLSTYYIVCRNDVEWSGVFKTKIGQLVVVGMIIINALSILISGGRGGVVLFAIIICFALIIVAKKTELTIATLFKYIISVVAIGMCLYFVILFAENSSLSSSGFKRIINALIEGDSSGRDTIYSKAQMYISDSPVYGHGIGSVFYLLGNHAHNMFLDVMIESGMLGIIPLVFLLFIWCRKVFLLCKKNISNCIWLFIFLDGFVMALFSGYYLVHLPMLGMIVLLFSKEEKDSLECSCCICGGLEEESRVGRYIRK